MHLKALVEFLSGLEQNNNRPWFAWNKPAYDVLREEFAQLVADVTTRVQKFDRALGPVDPKKAMFRIYRDTRFSKDRTPYKTHFSAAIRDRSKRGLEPGYYFHIDHQGVLLAGGGIYRPEPEILKRVRHYIAAKPATLTRMLGNARFIKTYDGFIEDDALVRPPKGFSADTPHIEAIKLRHFFAMTEVSIKKRPPKDLAHDLAERFRDLLPLMEWLRKAAAERQHG
ncbi:MAG: DUF2461 domain-containing protein [Pseudomonadota bacterium]|nr:DUF2461 domain-containing protein [Pseudomonadota bacterium]